MREREPTNISPEENARLIEAEKAFRNLGAEMRAFANADRFANRIVRGLGYNADAIAGALIAIPTTFRLTATIVLRPKVELKSCCAYARRADKPAPASAPGRCALAGPPLLAKGPS
jgi:hypothetical protein